MLELMSEVAKRCPNGVLPESYLVFDTETSGANPADDFILQYGFGVVRDGKLVDSFALLVKRGKEVKIHPKAIAVHGITHEQMAIEGMDPKEAFVEVLATFEHYRRMGMMFVGHNMIAFDAKLFENEARRYGSDFTFGDNEILDTGAIVKGAQMGNYFDPRHSIREWAYKVLAVKARGVFWSLDRYCFGEFKLAEYGLNKDAAHDAGYDCKLTHYVLCRLKERLQQEQQKAAIPEEEIPF